MLQPRCQFAGAHIHRGVLKAGIALFPREGGLSYPRHYVSRPIIPEGGYPGDVDELGQPLDADNYRMWLESLPTRMVLNPCLTHFIRIAPDTTRAKLESEIQRVFTPDVLTTVDVLLSDRGHTERESISRFRRMMNSPERLGVKLILPKGYGEQLVIAEAEAKFGSLVGELDGKGKILDIPPGTIDIGPGAINRSLQASPGDTYIDLANPANDTGTLDTFELWFVNAGIGVKAGTFYGSGSSYTSRDCESIGSVAAGSKQTFSGLDCDVESGDYAGIYYTSGTIERDTSGGEGVKYKTGDQFGTGTQTYFEYADDAISIYGTGDVASTEKSGSDSGSGADVLAARLASTTEAGTGVEASALTTSGAKTASDSGAGVEATPAREMVVAETGQAQDTATAPAAVIVAGDNGFGGDYSGMPEAAYGADTGQGQDAMRAKIEMAGAGVAMRLPGRPGRVSPSRKEVSG
jgi:hypothetical protein